MRYYERITDATGATHLRLMTTPFPWCHSTIIVMQRQKLQLESIPFGLVTCATCQTEAENEMDAFQTRVIQRENKARDRYWSSTMEGKRVG